MVDWLRNILFHFKTKFIVSRLNREVLLRKWSHFKAKLSLNHVYNYKQCSISNGGNIYLIGFAMGRGDRTFKLCGNNSTVKAPVFGTLNSAISNFQT